MRVEQNSQRLQSGRATIGCTVDLHALATLFIEHPLRNKKLIAARKLYLNLCGPKEAHLRTSVTVCRTGDDADSESSRAKHGQCVSALQKPAATRVAGIWTWKKLGRSVNAGAKGIRILAPMVGVNRKPDKEAEKDITKQNARVLLGFRNAYVFDISQTNGVDFPICMKSMATSARISTAAAFLKSQGIELVFSDRHRSRARHELRRTDRLLPGQSKAEEFSTLVHETAHEMLHKAERRTATTKTFGRPRPRQSPLWSERPWDL